MVDHLLTETGALVRLDAFLSPATGQLLDGSRVTLGAPLSEQLDDVWLYREGRSTLRIRMDTNSPFRQLRLPTKWTQISKDVVHLQSPAGQFLLRRELDHHRGPRFVLSFLKQGKITHFSSFKHVFGLIAWARTLGEDNEQ